jgi:hypothetical protein
MIDRQTLDNFRQDFKKAMEALEKQYGFIIDLGNITYSATSFYGKLEGHESDSRDDLNGQEFKMYCNLYGLDPEDYDRRFTYDGKDYIIIGIRPSKRKYTISCQRVQDGKSYAFTADMIRRLLGK